MAVCLFFLCQCSYQTMCCWFWRFAYCFPPVVYLIFFHLSFIMFVWSYWKTIFTKPASPSKEVKWPHYPNLCLQCPKRQLDVTVLFAPPVLPSQSWEGALREGREARVPAGNPVESSHQSASVHPHRSWRYVCMSSRDFFFFSVCAFVCCFCPFGLPPKEMLFCQNAAAIRYCDRCQVIKPDRCHHCSACDM